MSEPFNAAMEAMKHYPATCKSMEFIGHSASAVCQVTDSEGSRFSLRVHKPRSENLESFWTDRMPGIIRKLAGREAAAYLNDAPFLFAGTPYWA